MGFTWKWCAYTVPAILATAAFVFGAASNFMCETVQFTAASSDVAATSPSLKYGPWYQQQTTVQNIEAGDYTRIVTERTCVDYENIDIDSHTKTARAFSVLASIVGGLTAFVLILAPCLYYFSAAGWKHFAVFCSVVLCLFQGLTFMIFAAAVCNDNGRVQLLEESSSNIRYNDSCEWDTGSSTNVVATLCWFLCGISMVVVGVPLRPVRGPAETQEVTYARTTAPDGTSTVAEAKVVKGTAVPPPQPETAVMEGGEKDEMS